MKKIFTLFIGILSIAGSLWGQIMPTKGTGTLGDPYQIENLDHLLWISEGDGGTTPEIIRWSSHYKLMADIDASSTASRNNNLVRGLKEGFRPIGNETVPFSGSFNGNMRTITGLYIDNLSLHSGFFGKIEVIGEVNYIKDLTLKNVDIKFGQASLNAGYYGALAGQIVSMLISNCHVSGNITGRATAIK